MGQIVEQAVETEVRKLPKFLFKIMEDKAFLNRKIRKTPKVWLDFSIEEVEFFDS